MSACKVLVCQIDPTVTTQLKNEMKQCGWAVDRCEGMLEMLRLLQEGQYDFVVLNLSSRNVEIYTRLGAIRALGKNTKILLNVSDPEGFVVSPLMFEYPVITGALTGEKLLNAVQHISA